MGVGIAFTKIYDKSITYPKDLPMKQPGLDGRHRDKDGTISRKHGNTLNKNLPKPIDGFSEKVSLADMRRKTGEESEAGIRRAIAKRKK